MLLSTLFGGTNASVDDERFWGGDIPLVTSAGVRVTEETAMRHTAVYAAVKLLAETLASLPLSVYRRLPDGGKKALTEHPLHNLLHYQPNHYQSSFEFREMMQGHIGLRGNCYALKHVNAVGQIDALEPLHPNRVTPAWNENGRIIYKVLTPVSKGAEIGFVEKVYTAEEIFHVRGLTLDGLIGLSPIAHHRETIGLGMAAQEYGNRFFSNDATPKGVLEYPGSFKNDEDFNQFRARWQSSQGGANRGKTAVLENGMKYNDIGMTNEDAQFLDTKKYNVTDIARIFNIPPHMIGDLEKATFSNISDQAIQFVVHTMRPWFVRWEQAFKRDMIVEDDVFVEFNVDALLRGNIKDRYAAHAVGINTGFLTRNEARAMENKNPLPGLSEPLTPLNMDKGANEEPEGEEKPDREAELEEKAAERIARKEAKFIGGSYDALAGAVGNHTAFIEAVLAVDNKTANMAIDSLKAMFEENILIEDFIPIRTKRLIDIARGRHV